VAVLAAAYGGDLLLTGGDVPRHTVVGGVDIGGLAPAAAEQKLQRELAPRLAADHPVVAGTLRTTLSADDAGLRLDPAATVAAARRGALAPWSRVSSLLGTHDVTPVLTGSSTDLDAAVADLAAQVDTPAVEATVAVQGTSATVVPAADGLALDRRAAAAAITAALAHPGATVTLRVGTAKPRVATATAQQVLDGTVRPALSAPVGVVSSDGHDRASVPPAAIGAALTFTPQADGKLAVAVDPAKLQAALGTGFVGFGTPAKDATFAVSGGGIHVVPSVDGTGIDPAALATQLMRVVTTPAPRTVTTQLGPVHAAFTTEMAQGLGIKEQVSSFTTHFAATPSATNIRVVAAKVDGAVVKPGETFSLNTFTGPRGTAQGYVPAMVIESGKFVPAVGGGISQFATTMYNAVFFAGLQDVHHQPHSYWISRYPAGREATVFDGLIDLAWKNDSPTGIYVQTTWVQGSITVTFWGTKHYDVESVSGPRTNVVEPQVQDVPDDGSCKAQGGQQGFDIVVTRVWHPIGSGQVVKQADFRTHYKAEPVIHCLPTGTAPATAPGGSSPDATTPAGTATPSARRPGRRSGGTRGGR
jgi:vancomycin resistance protein YoaR